MERLLEQSTSENHNLKVTEELSALLHEFNNYAFILLNAEGIISSYSSGSESIYGYMFEAIVGKQFSIFYKAANQITIHHLRAAEKNGRFEFEGLQLKNDGSAFFATVIITALHNDDGSLKGFAHITRDISLQKKLEEENRILKEHLEEKVEQRTKELATVNQELEAFSYSVSHDLRTPLRAISGYSIMLKEDYETQLDNEGKRIIDTIINNTRMMGKLIDDLLTFSKLSKLEIISEQVNMKELAERCIAELLPTLQKQDYTINILHLPTCKGDGNMLKQVLHNLISNAFKYSSKKLNAQLEIGAKDDPKNHIYYVKDNGVGFDMKYLIKLFGVFQRLHRQDEFEGTGLGLALARRIISKHGGEINVEARLNEGATFYFSIPKNQEL